MDIDKLDQLIKNRAPAKEESQSKPKAKILVVDDAESIRRGLVSILSDYEVDTANNGKEAVDLFSANQKYAVIIMDALMPVMDGFKATKIIKKISSKVPIIMHTAYQDEHEISKIVDLGLFGYVTKGAVEHCNGELIMPNINILKQKVIEAIRL